MTVNKNNAMNLQNDLFFVVCFIKLLYTFVLMIVYSKSHFRFNNLHHETLYDHRQSFHIPLPPITEVTLYEQLVGRLLKCKGYAYPTGFGLCATVFCWNPLTFKQCPTTFFPDQQHRIFQCCH